MAKKSMLKKSRVKNGRSLCISEKNQQKMLINVLVSLEKPPGFSRRDNKAITQGLKCY
jgi:hypothetical protein